MILMTELEQIMNLPMISAFSLLAYLPGQQVASKSRQTKYVNILEVFVECLDTNFEWFNTKDHLICKVKK